MVFSSAEFLFAFLPVVFLIYTLISVWEKKSIHIRNGFLVCASLFFYAYGEPIFVLLMVISVIINAMLARWIAKGRHKKCFLILGIITDLGLLAVFKYTEFFCRNAAGLLGVPIQVPDIHLPVGISFFTFQILSYLIDVYRDAKVCQSNVGKVLLYVSFFPQLIAGPIVKYHEIRPYIEERRLQASEVAEGIHRFVLGLSKKLLLANPLGEFVDEVYSFSNSGELPTVLAWLGAVGYTLQIYYDFSGYSDMAIGLGHMFGFTFPENFDHPYRSISIREFWRKWHISLSSWFREYLYLPMGGNRNGHGRTERNKLIVFFFTGLWHGASWNFILWGLIHGIALVLEDEMRHWRVFKRINKGIGWFYTMLVVCLAFVWFRAENLAQGWNYMISLFRWTKMDTLAQNMSVSFLTPYYILILGIALIGCVGLFQRKKGGYFSTIVLYLLCLFAIAGNSYHPFIYFQF